MKRIIFIILLTLAATILHAQSVVSGEMEVLSNWRIG